MDTQRDKILVTGSSGLIGSAVATCLAKEFDVIGFDLKPPARQTEHVYFIKVDVSSDESVQAGLRQLRQQHGDRLASVIHLAAYYSFAGEPSPLYEQITVRGTQRLLRGLQDFQVQQFVFSSTMLVHKPCEPGQRIDERWPLDPRWDYPKSKVETEAIIHREHGNIPYVVLRIAGVYDDIGHSIPITNQIQRIYERRLTSELFPGDITRGQSFLHLEDLVEAIRLVVQRRGQLPKDLTLLLGEPETLSYDELQRAFGYLIYNEEWVTTQIPKALAKTGAWVEEYVPGLHETFIRPWMIDFADDHYALDITQAREFLGWEPRHSLRETLPKMIRALKADPVEWYRANKLGTPPAEIPEKRPDAAARLVAPATARVPMNTPTPINEQIRRETEGHVAFYATAGRAAIDRRLAELDREWDIERVLETNAAAVGLLGSVLGMAVDTRFFVLPALAAGFLLQHAIQGWCPPVTLFRRQGFRTTAEIDQERYALKALRGDFRDLQARAEKVARPDVKRALEAVRR